MTRSLRQSSDAANLAARLRAEAVTELDAVEDLSSAGNIPGGVLVKLALANAIAPQRNAQAALKSLEALQDWQHKGSPGELPADLEAEVKRLLDRQERPRRRNAG